jgi:hypothetical protein
MSRRQIVTAAVLGLSLAVVPAAANATQQVGAIKAPAPPKTGLWKISDAQWVSSGSMQVEKKGGHIEVTGLHGVFNAGSTAANCTPGKFTVLGVQRAHRITVKRTHQQLWAVGKRWNLNGPLGLAPVKVTVRAGGKLTHWKLAITFNPHQGIHAGDYDFNDGGDLHQAATDCDVAFGLKHK